MNLRTKVMQFSDAEYLSGLKYGTIKDNNTDCAKTLVICIQDDWDCVCWLGCLQNKFFSPLIPPIQRLILMKSHPLQGSFVHKSDFVMGCFNERMHRFIFACEQFRNTLSFYPLREALLEKKMFSFGHCPKRGPNFFTLFFHHVVPYILTSISCYVTLFGHF